MIHFSEHVKLVELLKHNRYWSDVMERMLIGALEGILDKNLRRYGIFFKCLKRYGILGSILGIWGNNAFWILVIFAILILGISYIFQNN